MLTFVGKLGGPEWGGLSLDEFSRRQAAYRDAEIAAMKDVPEFIRKGQEIYGYPHFVNDVGGSLCEHAEAGARDAYHKQIAALREKQDEARAKLESLRNAGEGAWQDLKAGVEMAWDAIGEAIESAKSRIRK